MKTILILLSLSLGFFATADQNPDCQVFLKGELRSACLSEEQAEYLTTFHILGHALGLTHNFTPQEKCQGSACLSEEQIEILQSLYTVDRKKAQAKEKNPPQEDYLKQKTTTGSHYTR